MYLHCLCTGSIYLLHYPVDILYMLCASLGAQTGQVKQQSLHSNSPYSPRDSILQSCVPLCRTFLQTFYEPIILISSTKYISKSPQHNIYPNLLNRIYIQISSTKFHPNTQAESSFHMQNTDPLGSSQSKLKQVPFFSRFQFQNHKPFVKLAPDALKYALSGYNSLIASARK